MTGKSDKPHFYGHRQRLRNRFLEGGAGALQDYELLELLLTFAIERSDVKPLAKALIARFGSFSQVLDAPMEALLEVRVEVVSQDRFGRQLRREHRLTQFSATLLRLVKSCFENYLREEALKRQKILSLSSLVDYCRTAMGGLKDEQFRVIYLNSQNEVIAEEIIQEGTVNQTVVYPRKVLELALKHKAAGLILVHNHPSGNPTPSAADAELTQTIIKAARPLNLTVHDHLIISRHGYVSLAEQNML
ncbi:MAG: DNA repair protein RadC [Deltaproteobacteria bacterium]|nr:DNA repair protein RadC [Deltaproteobacteria bacterium]